MPALIGFFRRKNGIAKHQFRRYYEDHHAPLAVSLFGDLFRSYRRNYIDGDNAPVATLVPQEDTADVITEIVFHDHQSMEEMYTRTARDSHIAELISTDEAAFMDRPATRLLIVHDIAESTLPQI